jgi:ribose-phosphate pyrophosphokinase
MAVHKCSLIADKDGYGWNYTKKIYDYLKNGFESNQVDIKRFRDGEIKPKIKNNIRKRNCYFIHDTALTPAEWFTEMCLINGTLKKSAAQEIVNVHPYLKYARQDRKDESRVPISAKVVADVIQLYAHRLMTLDVHNQSIDGFYNIPVDNLSSYPVVIKHLKDKHPELLENLVIMSTDAGGAPRAKDFAKKLGISDIAVGYKTREKSGEVESLKILGNIEDKNVLIIDDIVDSGGTLIKAYESARKNRAKKISCYCTHGLFTNGVRKITDCFDYFFIGDTLKLPEKPGKNTEIISFIPLFAEAIKRTSAGESLSELFD